MLVLARLHQQHSYARLDGATPQAKREAALADFSAKRNVRVMIISLKAG